MHIESIYLYTEDREQQHSTFPFIQKNNNNSNNKSNNMSSSTSTNNQNSSNEENNEKVLKTEPFTQNVLSIFIPGLLFSIILYFTNQIALGVILLTANISFVAYLLYQRCGVASQMTYKRGVSFNLRNMMQSPSNLLIQQRGLVSIRYLVENIIL